MIVEDPEDEIDENERDPGEDIDRSLDDNGGGSEAPQQALPVATPTTVGRPAQLGAYKPGTHGVPAPDAQPFFIASAASPPAKKQGMLRDLADQFMASAADTGADLAGFASAATRKMTENPAVVSWIEDQKRWLEDKSASWVSSMSPQGQLAAHAQLFGGGDKDAAGNRIPTPGEAGWARYIAHTVISALPAPVIAITGGALAATAVAALPEELAVAAGAAGIAATAGLFGAMQSGGWYRSFVGTIDKATPEQMMSSPVYHTAIEQGMSDPDARRMVVDKMMPFAGAQFAVGAAAGAGVGQLLTKGAMGAAGATLGRRAAIGATEGAATMGAQGGAADYLSQQANMKAGQQTEFDPSKTAEAIASGALGGAAMGAFGGAIHRGERASEPERQPETNPSRLLEAPRTGSPDTDVAMKEMLGLPAPAERLGLPKPTTIYGDGFTARDPEPEPPAPPAPLQLPKPDTTYGDGFTMRPPGAPAVSTAPQLPAPEQRQALAFNPDRSQGAAPPNQGLTVAPGSSGEPAKPSGGMNRGSLVDALEQSGQDRKVLNRLKIGELRSRYDEANTPPAPQSRGFRPETPQVGEVPLPVSDHPVDKAAAKAAEPSPAQSEAGNYQKGHVQLHGLDVTIETPKSSVRKGPIDETTGEPAWQTTMPAHYGYVKGTKGADGDHVDVQLGPRVGAMFDGSRAEAANHPVYVVDQIDPKTAKFDEHKAFLGFHTAVEAARAYDESFSDGSGPTRRGAVTEMSFQEFKDWTRNGDTTKPIAYKKPTVGDQLKAKRQAEKARMAEPPGLAKLIKREDVKPRIAETKIEDEPEDVGAEVTNQPQVFERDNATPVVKTETGPETARSEQTSNLDRKLADLETKVRNGELSAFEASKEYGVKMSVGGRARRYPEFADYLRARIEQAEDPKAQEALVERMQVVNDMPAGPKRVAAMRSISAEVDSTGPEHAERLRQMLRDVEDPVAAAAADQERVQRQAGRLNALKGMMKRREAPAPGGRLDARLNSRVLDVFNQAHEAREPVSVHKYLDTIADDPVMKVRMPQYVALARQLRKMLPEDLAVASHATADEMAGKSVDLGNAPAAFQYARDPSAGQFISMNEQYVGQHPDISPVELVLHEATHAVTTRYLEALPASSPDRTLLREIRYELTSYLRDGPLDRFTETEAAELDHALSNDFELHTMLMSNPIVQRIAGEATPSADFLRRMDSLGFGGKVRSVWQAFTNWVRRAVGLPDSAASNSLLDHILQPLTEITDRADEFNHATRIAEHLPADATLRAIAEPTAEAASHAFPSIGRRDVIDRIDPKGLSDRGRRAVLSGATTDGIVKWNRDLFKGEDGRNSLEDYRAATEAIAARSKDFRDEHSDAANKLFDGFNKLKGPERERAAALMNDATLADMRLGPKANNDHVTKPDALRELRSLQGRYDALSPEGRKTYDGFRDYYRKTYDIERDAQLGSAVRIALPDATPEQIESLTKSLRTKRGINQLIDNPDASDVAARFAEAWDSNRPLVRAIARMHAQGFVQGDYFPLRRFGDYVLHYGTKGTDDYGVEMFERRSQADARRLELLKAGTEPSQVLDKRASKMRNMIPTTVMDELDAAVRHSKGFSGEQADAVRDLFASVLMQQASRSESARTMLRRQNVKGASGEVSRVLARDFLALSSRLGYLEHGPARAEALAAMRRHSDWLGRNGKDGEQIRANIVTQEIEKRQPAGDDSSGNLTGLARKFSVLGFTYSLMSPSHMLTSTIEAHMNSTALLGARFGYARAGLALAKALKDTAPVMAGTGARHTLKAMYGQLKAADWNLSTVVRDRLIAGGGNRDAMMQLFDRLNAAGLIDHSVVREMQRIANPQGDVTKGWWDRFLDMNGAGAHAVDVANKTAIAKAAFDLELARSKNQESAIRYAVETARQTMPNYNVTNKARVSTAQGPLGGFAGPLTQFKQYGLHMYSMMAGLLHASTHGASKQERVEARKAFAGVLATHALMAGSLTLIADPLRYVGGAYDWITGADKPHDYQNDVRQWITSAFGPELGEVIARGAPHAAGIDIHRRVGLANLLEVPELNEFSAKGIKDMLATAMTGAGGEDAVSMAAAAHKMLQGDVMAGIQGLVPRVFRDPMKAYNLADKGVTDSKGKTILPAAKLSGGDIAAQAVGFQPARVSEFREARNAVIEARQEGTSERSHAMAKFLAAAPSDRGDALTGIQEYNRAHPEATITYSQLMQSVKKQNDQAKTARSFGVQLPAKSIGLSKAGSFANVGQ